MDGVEEGQEEEGDCTVPSGLVFFDLLSTPNLVLLCCRLELEVCVFEVELLVGD